MSILTQRRGPEHTIIRKINPTLGVNWSGGSWTETGNEETWTESGPTANVDSLVSQFASSYKSSASDVGTPISTGSVSYRGSGTCHVITITAKHICGDDGDDNAAWEQTVRVAEMKWVDEDSSSGDEDDDSGGDDSGDTEEEEDEYISYSVTAVEQNILTHPKAQEVTEDAMEGLRGECLRLYLAGHPMSYMVHEDLSDPSSKKVSIGSQINGFWAQKKIAAGITSYLDFVVTATRRTVGKPAEAYGTIVSGGGGLPKLGSGRNWLVIGTGCEMGTGKKKIYTTTYQSSGAAGWDKDLYGS